MRRFALNRAAMASPELAETLLASGRHRVGPLVERYLATIEAGTNRRRPARRCGSRLHAALRGWWSETPRSGCCWANGRPSPTTIAEHAAEAVDLLLDSWPTLAPEWRDRLTCFLTR